MWQHFKPFVGCFKSLLCHRDSEGGEHAQELSFCIVVPNSARKGHRETRGNSSEKIQRSRDSPCTWWDNTFTYLNIQLHNIDIQNYMLNTLLYICQVNDHFRSTGCWSSWRLDLSRISSFCWSISDVRNSTWSSSRSQGERCNLLGWIATFANVSPDLLVNLHFFLGGTTGLWTSYDGFCPVCNTGGVRKLFSTKNSTSKLVWAPCCEALVHCSTADDAVDWPSPQEIAKLELELMPCPAYGWGYWHRISRIHRRMRFRAIH